ncbi:hypothetical protein [Epibacterium ulvae]|uniref:hypothetical protein n=1 Tax=Epibacterium ulvae TaxID=1156985 RepID=UPI0024936577|nr:hypothetical protein [Epibacterium ulvae]
MQRLVSTIALATVVALTSTAPVLASDAELKSALAGKTLTNGKAVIKVRKNGRMTGKVGPNGDVKLVGAWEIRDGKWCRTIKEPKGIAATKCQPMKLSGNTLTIDGDNGPQAWTVK